MPHPLPGRPEKRPVFRPARGPTAPPRKEPVRENPAPTPAPAPGPRRVPDRLPDGSQFQVRFDAPAQLWRGSLTVGAKTCFLAESRSVFGLLSKLDTLYRHSLKADSAAAPPQPGKGSS